MSRYEFAFASSLEKVFADRRPAFLSKKDFTVLRNDKISFQLVHSLLDRYSGIKTNAMVTVKGAPCGYSLRTVELVPSNMPGFAVDTQYKFTSPGMFPDLLKPSNGEISILYNQFRSVWIDIPTKDAAAGSYDITVNVVPISDGVVQTECIFSDKITINVVAVDLPKPMTMHTEWFHADCIADYYNIDVFSEKHWEYIDNFIGFANKSCAINMILTPIFSLPLDVEVGGERTTLQLIDVEKNGDKYTFNFDKLGRWCDICIANDIETLEISHFFTQWGAKATPKIMATVDGRAEKLFGWHVEATDSSYRTFLQALIPQLLQYLHGKGYGKDQIFFHVSDEPSEEHIEHYLAAKAQVKDLLNGYNILDALSSFKLFEDGVVDIPIPSNDHIKPFLNADIKTRWVYYCIGQQYLVPNRFFALESARSRIMGVLMYLNNIDGFLHWGYNFYNAQYSKKHINPFLVTDADMGFNSGDAFLVYPGDDGIPWGSIRSEVNADAFYDIAAFKLLEEFSNRETVLELINKNVGYDITFEKYPTDAKYLLDLREAVAIKIKDCKGE